MVKKKAAKNVKAPNPVGRPTKYKPEYCQQLIDYMIEDGKPITKPMVEDKVIVDHHIGYLPHFFEGFAVKIGVCHETLREWRGEHPQFSAAYKKAKNIQLEKMAKGALGGTLVPSTTIFALKNMFGWKDKKEVSTDPENPLTITITKTYER